MQAWLPDPHFNFRGGPVDGQRLAVRLNATDWGNFAPEYWEVYITPPHRLTTARKIAADIMIERAVYKFVPTSHRPNQGFYAYVPPSGAVQEL